MYQVPGRAKDAERQASATAEASPRTSIVACPACRTKFRISAERLAPGTRMKCSRCQSRFVFAPRPIEADPAPVTSPVRFGSGDEARRLVPAPVRPQPRGAVWRARAPRSFLRRNAVLLGLLGGLAAITAFGLRYYTLPIAGRLRSPLHDWLKPSGYVGQSAGILAFALFVFLWLYPLRKKFRWLAFTGGLGRWLDVHVVAGFLVPVLGAIHAGWRFDGLIGLGYFFMLSVSLSGFVGRYLYRRIPHGRSGLELSLGEIESRRIAMVQRIAETTGIDRDSIDRELREAVAPRVRRRGISGALIRLFSNDLRRWRALRALGRRWRNEAPPERHLERKSLRQAVRLARRQLALTQQVRMLEATQRLFRYWHVAHRPFAVTALVAVTVHVVVVVALGVTWFW